MTTRVARRDLPAAARRRARALAAAEWLRAGAGFLLLAAFVFAPWCWGCAWPAGIGGLDLLLLTATTLWLGAALLRRERRPLLLRWAILFILLQGWALTLNARSLFADGARLFAPLDQPLSGWPGSVERDLSLAMMARVTALMGALLMAASLGRERRWRRRICRTVVLTSVSIVLLGCAQRWSGATDIFWSHARHLDYFFASYRNVTNAGEYLNLALPPALAAAWSARGGPAISRAAAVCALAVLVVGIGVCGSKAAPLLAFVLVAGFLVSIRSEVGCFFDRRGVALAAILFTASALMTWGAGTGTAQDRWSRFLAPSGSATISDRWAAARTGAEGLGGAGVFGYGPGTFPAVFAWLQNHTPSSPDGCWLAAHDDYLQAGLEWGLLGTAAGGLIYGGAAAALVLGLRRGEWRSEDRGCATALLLALAGLAVMSLADFPMQVASIQLTAAGLVGLGWSSHAWPRAGGRGNLKFTCTRPPSSYHDGHHTVY